ncbi:MAG TPA: hypothetical protein VGB15_09245 [Longimicrobium sp.]|jgi:hypothetical protein
MERLTDAERLAALLDGRLGERERAELMARLGGSGEDLDLLADAAAVTRELEAEDRAAGVEPITAPRPAAARPRPPWRWVSVAAAAAVLLALAPRAWRELTGGPPAPEEVVALLDDPAYRPPPGGWEPPPSGGTRGGRAGLNRRTASVQFGALSASLATAARAGDSARVRSAASDAAAVLRSRGNVVDAGRYAAVAGRGSADATELARLLRSASETLDPPAVSLGVWAEGARVAARQKDAAFFAKPVSQAYLSEKPPELWPEAVEALALVRSAALRGGAPDWAALEEALYTLLETLS